MSLQRFFIFINLALQIASAASASSAETTSAAAATAETPFDPTDPQYQVNPRFPPDKASTWTYGTEHDGWWIAHEALRGELDDMQEILDQKHRTSSTAMNRTQVVALRRWWRGHLQHMHSHHRNEDRVARRFASRRFFWPAFLDADHEDILQRLDAIDALIQGLCDCCCALRGKRRRARAATTSSADAERLLLSALLERLGLRWAEYRRLAAAHHFAREEAVCIPLMRAYFTPRQVQRLQRRLAMTGPRVEAGGIVHYCRHGDDDDDGAGRRGKRIRETMRIQKTPKVVEAIAWHCILKPRYKFYVKTMVKQLEILRGED